MWSYSGNPANSAKDAVRFEIGDTDQTDPLLQDEEINYFLAQYNNFVLNTAIRCLEAIMAKFSRMVNEAVGGVRIDFTDRIKNMDLMKRAIIQRLATESATPYAGGIFVSDEINNLNNPNIILPDFTKHMMENDLIAPWTTSIWALWGDQGPWFNAADEVI